MAGRLEGKVAIVTGAAGGMGLKTVERFIAEGAKVTATDFAYEQLCERTKGLDAERILTIRHDVTNEENWAEVVDRTVEKFGQLDVLVNNAGIFVGNDITTQQLDEWNRIISIDLTGCYLGIKACFPVMGTEGHSAIVNISSSAGLVGGPRTGNDAAYTAAKGGLRLLTKHCAHALASRRIRCNSIHPGGVWTPMMQQGLDNDPKAEELLRIFAPLPPHYSQAEDVVNLSLFLASDESKTITGAEVAIDNGMTSY